MWDKRPKACKCSIVLIMNQDMRFVHNNVAQPVSEPALLLEQDPLMPVPVHHSYSFPHWHPAPDASILEINDASAICETHTLKKCRNIAKLLIHVECNPLETNVSVFLEQNYAINMIP